MIKVLIFDGDDTLWECAAYYWECRDKFIAKASHRTGLSEEFCAGMFSVIDGHMLSLKGAFGRERFPTAFKATSLALDAVSGMEPNLTAANMAFNTGDSVFYAPYELFPGVKKALEELKSIGFRMILNTKGDYEVQHDKVRKNRLTDIFDKIYVTVKKDEAWLKKILRDEGIKPSEAVCIGDSMRDDVATPAKVGCVTVWISDKSPDEWAPKWEYEAQGKGFVRPDYWVTSVASIPTLALYAHVGDPLPS